MSFLMEKKSNTLPEEIVPDVQMRIGNNTQGGNK